MKQTEVEGKTVTLAVEKGLIELGLRRDQVEVQVLQEANPGFLGLGAKLARVRITEKIWGKEGEPSAPPQPAPESQPRAPRPAPRPGRIVHQEETRRREPRPARAPQGHRRSGDQTRERNGKHAPLDPPADPAKACAEAKALVDETFKALGFEAASVSVEWDAAQSRVRAEVETADEQLVVGKDGKTLEAIQFLTTLMLGRRMKTPVAVQVETGGYWRQKEESILAQVYQAIEEVKRTGRLVRLQPMEASLRRMVHRTLAQSPDVETVSEGEGSWRKIVLKPKKK